MDYDVIISGAGPGGSTAGYELAQRGHSVLILEKEALPRQKLCAGGLPLKILRIVDLPDGQIVEDRVNTVEFSYRLQERYIMESSKTLIYTVRRSRFDDFLVRKARSAGCRILEEQPVRELDVRRDRVLVRTPQSEFSARVLVGADGIGGAVARLAGFRHRRRIINAWQANIPMDSVLTRRYRGRAWIGFGWVRNGYAWVFPKRDHLTVGMGASGRGRQAVVFKKTFRSLLGKLFPEHLNASISSFPIALGGTKQNLVRGRILLVGEAANLVHPLTAEGIYYAIRSAQLASQTVDDFLTQRTHDLSPYQGYIDREIGSHFKVAKYFAGFFYGFPRFSFRVFVKNNERILRYFSRSFKHHQDGLSRTRC